MIFMCVYKYVYIHTVLVFPELDTRLESCCSEIRIVGELMRVAKPQA